jgi:aspartate/methionine/tyrosine aminotransferase
MAGIRRISQEEHEKRMELYNLGLQDKEIAKRLFTCPPNICQWRIKHGLSPNKYNEYNQSDRKRMDLYRQGLSDNQIGKAVNRGKGAILMWRRARNLPANYNKSVKIAS